MKKVFVIFLLVLSSYAFSQTLLPSSDNTSKVEEQSSPIIPEVTTEDIANSMSNIVKKIHSSIDYVIEKNSVMDWVYFLIIIISICVVLIPVLRFFLSKLVNLSSKKKDKKVYNLIIKDIAKPIYGIIIVLGFNVSQHICIDLGMVGKCIDKIYLLLYSVFVAWLLFNLSNVVEELILIASDKAGTRSENRAVAVFTKKFLRICVIVFTALFILDAVFVQNIGAWIAGLGIVGLAVSFAAQDSIKNFLGSVMVLFDRPFKIGDRIKILGYDGIVEYLGFRSTKIRSYGTGDVVYIPNSALVSSDIDNISKREYLGTTITLSIDYETSSSKMKEVMEAISKLLNQDWLVDKLNFKVSSGTSFSSSAYFTDFNNRSLNVYIYIYYAPANWTDFSKDMEKFNFQILEELDRIGVKLYKPITTVK